MNNNPEQPKINQENNVEIGDSAYKQLEKINNDPGNLAELSPRDAEAQAERARQEALSSAVSVESGNAENNRPKTKYPQSRKVLINKKMREESYSRTMEQIQNELPAHEKIFSKIIHNKAIEKTSDIASNTITRPNAMLLGAIFAFILTLITYAIAKTIGYQLSGFETILAFIIGWLVGIIFDYFHVLFTGNK